MRRLVFPMTRPCDGWICRWACARDLPICLNGLAAALEISLDVLGLIRCQDSDATTAKASSIAVQPDSWPARLASHYFFLNNINAIVGCPLEPGA